MNIELLQKLARSDEHQILFNRSKEISSLQLFKNNSDLSKIQTLYLYFLSLYSMLFQDLSSGEDYISEEIIEDSIRTEAYLLLRKEKKDKKQKVDKNKNVVNSALGQGSLIFRRKKA